jgi:hypothetical protein
MKTVGILLVVLLAWRGSRLAAQVLPARTSNPAYAKLQHDEAAVSAKTDKGEHKPCDEWLVGSVYPASPEDTAAFKRILDAVPSDLEILLYVSHDSKLKNYGGALSFRCKVDNHEIYDSYENWTIYDPDLIQGDAARDFVFAHEIAHHIDGDTWSERRRSKQVELRADYNGANYLLRMGWNKARLLHALDLLDLPQSPQRGYPTLEERKAIVEAVGEPEPPAPPTLLWGRVIPPPPYQELLDELLKLRYQGQIRFQSIRTNEYVCAIGTPDPKIPSSKHFAFFDNCEVNPTGLFDLRTSVNDRPGYWILQPAEPCPDYAGVCQYALESDGHQLQFWNQDFAADPDGWTKELGERELFSFEVTDRSEGLVRIRARTGGYIFVDPKTAKLQNGGSQEQATEFKVQFDSN